jgi:hypothetical protein
MYISQRKFQLIVASVLSDRRFAQQMVRLQKLNQKHQLLTLILGASEVPTRHLIAGMSDVSEEPPSYHSDSNQQLLCLPEIVRE